MAFCISDIADATGPAVKQTLAQSVTEALLRKHGATMGFAEIGDEMRISAGAMRLRQFRVGDLPPPIPHLREHRWPTPVIALWLCGLPPVLNDTPPVASPTTAPTTRRPGRPRKFAPSTAEGGQA